MPEGSTLAAAGLTGLIAASVTAFTVVKYAGAAYLLYLGVRKLLEYIGLGVTAALSGGGHARPSQG